MAILSKKQFNVLYNVGAAIVIIGALFKINHLPMGSLILGIGLVVEAIIFFLSAFDSPEKEYDWEKVYPELAEGSSPSKAREQSLDLAEIEGGLSGKLDVMLSEAKIDSALFNRLGEGIAKFESAVTDLNKTNDAASATQRYGDQLALASNHMESLNALYQVQLEHGKKQVELNKSVVDDMAQSAQEAAGFKEQMAALNKNLESLNKVYGGMLSAMKVNG